jgi:hypothetical protein
VVTTVNGQLAIKVDWERLDQGSPEECACFGALSIQIGNVTLTEGNDAFVKRVRSAPLLSAYHLAEWIAWNWWRLRWEPRSSAPYWAFAHRLATIGGGYVWPNITIFSDGQLTTFIAKPTQERPNTPFRYLSDVATIVNSDHYEAEVDRFIEQVRGQLREEKIADSNLDRIWQEVRDERADPAAAQYRKFEALLGNDPDAGDQSSIETLIADARKLGQSAMNEVAADHAQGGELLTGANLTALSNERGFEGSVRDIVRLNGGSGLPRYGDVPAWRLGAAAAQALREQEKMGEDVVSNARLAELAGVETRALTERIIGSKVSFALDHGQKTRVVFRSKWVSGRRFELARLLCDRIIARQPGSLFPATRSYTYRQKMQRSFAAELLSPFEALEQMLAGDYSIENQLDAAQHFQVSELTIRTLLVNHNRLEREELNEEFDVAAA